MRNDTASAPNILIITTSNGSQAAYWQERLSTALPLGLKKETVICCVTEDWPSGAGTLLGTLLACENANVLLRRQGKDLLVALHEGMSVVMVHTAGNGTRLAPLTLAENNNKSAVVLPAYYTSEGEQRQLTILEAVIKQICDGGFTKGRLSVFWGDQLFLSEEAKPLGSSGAHIAVASQWRPMPTQEQWHKDHLDRYGIIAVGVDGFFNHLEKVSFDTLTSWSERHRQQANTIATSLGSFSISVSLLAALLEEFTPELSSRSAKMDIEPYVWMATVLDEESYLELMQKRGMTSATSLAHFRRMNALRQRLISQGGGEPYYFAEDVGSQAHWWDFGTLSSYYGNLIEMTKGTERGIALRHFLEEDLQSSDGAPAISNEDSIILNSKIAKGKATNSILVGVEASEVKVENVVAFASNAKDITGNNGIAYRMNNDDAIHIAKGEVVTEVLIPNAPHPYIMHTTLERDGKADWDQVLPGNPCSYAALQEMIKEQTSNIKVEK